jgi:hypothetical protein
MRVPEANRVLARDVPGAPGWLTRLLDPLNRSLSAFGKALNGQLIVGENVTGFYADVPFTTRADYPVWDTLLVACPFRARAALIARLEQVAPVYTPIASATSLDWILLDGLVQVRGVAGLTASTPYVLTLLVLP